MAEAPWSRTLVLAWRPSVAYTARQSDFAVALEESNLVIRAFRIERDHLDVQVGGRLDEVSVTPKGLTYDSIGRPLDRASAEKLLALALDAMKPDQVRVSGVKCQYLVPLDTPDYDAARGRGLKVFCGDWAGQVGAEDFALLVNGTMQAWHYQVEFGIVNKSEIPNRLSRVSTRIHDRSRQLPAGWDEEGLPTLALFVDTVVRPLESGAVSTPGVDSVMGLWDSAERSAGVVVERLEQTLSAADG